MKKFKKCLIAVLMCVAIVFTVCLSGCALLTSNAGGTDVDGVYVTQLGDATDDENFIITVVYSDGRTQEIKIPVAQDGKDGANGADGKDGADGADGKDGADGTPGAPGADGEDGKDGADGKDLTIQEIYDKYVEENGEISYNDFLKEYFPTIYDDSNACVGECLLSSFKVHSEFIMKTQSFGYPSYENAIASGSAVVWSMDGDKENGYTYLVTNYHVIYEPDSDSNRNGGTHFARKITAYVYGSEYKPQQTTSVDSNGYAVYNYGSYGISCEYVGGAASSDIAIIRAKTSDILAINDAVKPVKLASGYRVGEKAIAIGNSENLGISVTEGILSVIDENISLSVDGTSRVYRSLRIDTAIYEGNSGGGLFNSDGELIGITNAGAQVQENINYAIPLEIVKGTADNIMYYFREGKTDRAGKAYKITFGVTVASQNVKYVYDPSLGYGYIQEDVTVQSTESGSMANVGFSLLAGDIIKAVIVNKNTEKETRYEVLRSTDISDAALNIRPGDTVQIEYIRGGEKRTSALNTNCYVKFSEMNQI